MTPGIQEVVYRRPSALADDGLTLETAGLHASYFTGFLTAARPAAMCLATLADVAAADFRRDQFGSRGLRDPVVTCGGERLRFESLSGCCGLYARLDVLPAALDGAVNARGTTNVDINPPLYTALTQVGGGDPLRLTVGPDELAVTTLGAHVVEKRVPLPERWLRGLAEAGFLAAGFDLHAEISGGQAAALLHRLPAHRGDDRWLVPAGRSVRAAAVAAPGAVCLAGAHRLSLFRPLLPYTRTLRLYGPSVTAGSGPMPSGWEFDLGAVRFSVLLSPGVFRGLSGEGGLLSYLEDADALADRLGWDGTVDPAALAAAEGLTGEQVRSALAALAISGKVGYDWSEAGWFHRELPYRSDLLTALQPRHVAARALVAAGEVRPTASGYQVRTRLVHRAADGTWGCTCPWWTERYGRRGPCKHILAVSLLAADGPA
ncbi:SWIM zinc finger family protein [Cryptosporangium minutisporangium]|uniref:SWIM zinc finger domain-containing protein n=1 Tax=Cryptosporangium minutisporangium TaxID=113569 RepID=A0ABP6SZA6_9ACTN